MSYHRATVSGLRLSCRNLVGVCERPFSFSVDADSQAWPPCDPTTQQHHDSGLNEGFVLPSSPWTFEDGTLNPSLKPSNAQLRSSRTKRRRPKGVLAVPPYHPDFRQSPPSSQYASSSSESEEVHNVRPLIRRGSEGYEILPVDREEMLRRFIETRGLEDGRYNVYVPEPDVESDGDLEMVGEDGDLLSGQKVKASRGQ